MENKSNVQGKLFGGPALYLGVPLVASLSVVAMVDSGMREFFDRIDLRNSGCMRDAFDSGCLGKTFDFRPMGIAYDPSSLTLAISGESLLNIGEGVQTVSGRMTTIDELLIAASVVQAEIDDGDNGVLRASIYAHNGLGNFYLSELLVDANNDFRFDEDRVLKEKYGIDRE